MTKQNYFCLRYGWLILSAALANEAFADDVTDVERPSAEYIGLSGGSSRGDWSQKGGELDDKVRDLTVLADIGYITSRRAHQGIDPLAFTDLGIWNIAASFTPERRLTFSGGLSGLAKTPYGLDVRTLQAANGGIAFAFHKHLAIGASAAWSPGLPGTRDVRTANLDITWRRQHSDFIKTEMSVGASGINIRPDADADDGSLSRTTTQLSAAAEMQLCWGSCRERMGATWFGFDAGIPVHNSREESDAVGANLDSSLGFHVGSFMRVNKTFDVYASVKWNDRGDARDITTELPILLGGFDQVQMSLGAIFYFGFGKAQSDYAFESVAY